MGVAGLNEGRQGLVFPIRRATDTDGRVRYDGSFGRRPYKMRPKRLEKVDPVGQPGDSRPLVSEGHLRAIAAYGPFHE